MLETDRNPNTILDIACDKLNQSLSSEIRILYAEFYERLCMLIEDIDAIQSSKEGEQLKEDKSTSLKDDFDDVCFEIQSCVTQIMASISTEGDFIFDFLKLVYAHRISQLPCRSQYYLIEFMNGKKSASDIQQLASLDMNIEEIKAADLEFSVCDLNTFFNELLKMLRYKQIPQNIIINTHLPSETASFALKNILHLTYEAIFELVTNAIHAMPDGGKITISADVDGQNVILTVKDTGKGISKENLPKVLHKGFSQTDGGTGLGLPLAKEYFEDILGGKFEIDSEEGKGTTIKIVLPKE